MKNLVLILDKKVVCTANGMQIRMANKKPLLCHKSFLRHLCLNILGSAVKPTHQSHPFDATRVVQ